MSADRLEGYKLPTQKLVRNFTKRPVVLIACGSYSPITNMHLRLFELARDSLHGTEFEVVGQYLSPVNDGYAKKGLVSAKHRIAMCELASQNTAVMVDDWESRHEKWLPTRQVLDHFASELTKELGGVRPEVYLLCGTDLLDSFNTPGLWSDDDMAEILGGYGLVCVQRNETDADKLIAGNALMSKFKDRIRVVNQWMHDITSSTILRSALSKGSSIRFLTPDAVIEYIYANNLFDIPEGSRPFQAKC